MSVGESIGYGTPGIRNREDCDLKGQRRCCAEDVFGAVGRYIAAGGSRRTAGRPPTHLFFQAPFLRKRKE